MSKLEVSGMLYNPEKDNPCWGCKYRKLDEMDCINVCLLDENLDCIREEVVE